MRMESLESVMESLEAHEQNQADQPTIGPDPKANKVLPSANDKTDAGRSNLSLACDSGELEVTNTTISHPRQPSTHALSPWPPPSHPHLLRRRLQANTQKKSPFDEVEGQKARSISHPVERAPPPSQHQPLVPVTGRGSSSFCKTLLLR